MPDAPPDIAIIIVSCNTRGLLADCLKSVAAKQASGLAETWVVDNASSDSSADMVAKDFPAVHLIRNDQNRGFAAANNQALSRASGRFFFLLNSDARVLGDCCEQLQAALMADGGLGIVGPRLLNPDGSVQPSWGSFPNPINEFFFQSFLFKLWPSGLPYGRRVHPLQRAAYRRFRQVDWVTGAALMLRRELYETLGGLPEDTFMYAEDLEYCWRAQKAGFHSAYCPAAQVVHLGQASAGRDYQRWIVNYTGALLAYYERHCALADWRAAAYLIWGGSLLRQGLWRILGRLRPAHRQEADSRVAGYAEAAGLAWKWLRTRGQREAA